MKKNILPIVALVALLAGLLLGYALGQWTMERKWSDPLTTVSAEDFSHASSKEADPTPSVGTRILKPIPLGRVRRAAASFTASDPLRVELTSFGNGEDGSELHLVIRNNSECSVTSYSGVAYAYDARGRASKANLGGESYVAFSAKLDGKENKPIAPKGKHIHSQALKYPETASIGVAHVDAYTCSDGRGWKRNS